MSGVLDARPFLGGPVRVDLVRLVEQVVGQVWGGDERAALENFLERARPGEQTVVINLAEVIEDGNRERVGCYSGPGGLSARTGIGDRAERVG